MTVALQNNPSLEELILGVVMDVLRDLWTGLPARVERYDSATQTVDCQPIVKQAFIDERSERQTEDIALLIDVPVLMPYGGDFGLTLPIQTGDFVWVLCGCQSIEKWLANGGDRPLDPRDDRRFDLSDAVAVPGLRHFRDPRSTAPTDRIHLGHDNGASVSIRQNEVRLGGDDASDPVALRSDLQDISAAILSTIASNPPPNPIGAAFAAFGDALGLDTLDPPVTTPPTGFPVSAQQVKAK